MVNIPFHNESNYIKTISALCKQNSYRGSLNGIKEVSKRNKIHLFLSNIVSCETIFA